MMFNITGEYRGAIKLVVPKLNKPPCPNKSKKIQGKTMSEILQMFWLEFKNFQKKTGPFDKHTIWLTSAALTSTFHICHDLYLLAYTEMLSFVACITISKPFGIGSYERSWGDVKHIKPGKRSHMGAESTKNRAVLYTIANIHEARIRSNRMETLMQ